MSLTGGLAAASQTYCLADEGSELRSAIKKERLNGKTMPTATRCITLLRQQWFAALTISGAIT